MKRIAPILLLSLAACMDVSDYECPPPETLNCMEYAYVMQQERDADRVSSVAYVEAQAAWNEHCQPYTTQPDSL